MLLVMTAVTAIAAAAPQAVCVLQPGAPVWDVVAEDLTGDGHRDILAVCCDKDADPVRKYVAVFLAADSGGYADTPTFILPLAPKTGVLFPAETDGAPPRELVAAHAHGATIYAFRDGGFTAVSEVAFTSLLPSGAKELLFLRDVAKDLDGDGIHEWFLPIPEGFAIYKPDAPLSVVACDIMSEVRRSENLYIYHRLPAYHVFPLEGQPVKAIAFLSDEYADFAYGEKWTQHKRFRIPLNVDDKWDASVRMADIDGNGLPDLIVTQTKGTVNLLALTQIYLAESPFHYPERPTATYETKGAMTSPFLLDVNGDGRDDLIFIKIPLGLKSFVNYFLRRKLIVEVHVHLFQDGGFSPAPDYSQVLALDAPEGREQIAYAMGDFNGDKRLDVALGTGAGNLVIHTGAPNRFLLPRPWTSVDIPSFGIARAIDLDQNGCDDIVLFHPGMPSKERIEVVMF